MIIFFVSKNDAKSNKGQTLQTKFELLDSTPALMKLNKQTHTFFLK